MGQAWINQIFRSGMANKGCMVRRSMASVGEQSSEKELVAAVKARGYHMIIQGDQYLIFCDEKANTTFIC